MKVKIKITPKRMVSAAVLLVVLIFGIVSCIRLMISDTSEAKILTVSTLSKIINTSEFSTYRTVYNGVAKALDEKSPDKVDYYVSYQATVEAGIDFSQTQIAVDDTAKTVVITLPEVTVTDTAVDPATLDYIFVDKKTETSTVSEQALKLCEADVLQEVSGQTAILTLAHQNARNAVEALTQPLVSQSNPDYTLTVQ